MVTNLSSKNFLPLLSNTSKWLNKNRAKCLLALMLFVTLFIYLKPQKFADLWLTRDQQGQVLFNLGHYDKASIIFDDTRWRAYSLYGAEQFEKSTVLYNQYNLPADVLARANALAHDRRYIKARNIYQEILDKDANNQAALNNVKIVQTIIDDVNRLSKSQKAEDSDSVKELGDEPQTGDGAEKKEAKQQKIEQLNAEQLLLDPKLNEMWLRQVQKDPARFLTQKFYMQNELKQTVLPLNNLEKSDNEKGSDND